jgi:Protein of unknown function (DUF3618)
MTAESYRSIDEIELEIARTRARLSMTADALADELAPPRLIEKGVDMFNGFFSRPDGIRLGGGVRADPVALALVGLGVAWLVAENAGLLDGLIPDRSGHPTSPAENIVALPSDKPIQSNVGSGNGWIHQVASATQGAWHSVYDRGGAVIGQASELIAHPTDSSERVRQAGGQMIEAVERNPLLLGLAGLAIGAAIAMLRPTSRSERKIAAQARDDLWNKAEEIGLSAANSMRELAETAAHSADETPVD